MIFHRIFILWRLLLNCYRHMYKFLLIIYTIWLLINYADKHNQNDRLLLLQWSEDCYVGRYGYAAWSFCSRQ